MPLLFAGIYHSIHKYAKASNKYYNKNRESSYNQYLDPNNLYGGAISQNLLENAFEWVRDIKVLRKNFIKLIKNYDEDSAKSMFLM